MGKINFEDIAPWVAATFFIMRYLTRFLETEKRLPKLHHILKFAWLWSLILMTLCSLVGVPIHKYFLEILSLATLYLLYKSKEYQLTRTLLIAIIPYILVVFVITFLKLITPKFLSTNSDFFDSVEGFAIAWMIGFGFYAQKQNKKEKIQRQKEAEERRVLEAKKEHLEFQVAERTAELTQQKDELEQALIQLKATQNQLIQSEKLASLGELTAGIAHEIQNPLNFVNNFSELSVDLIQEIKEERKKAREERDEAFEDELLSDLIQNQEKINHHGKRASSIVTGMLEHSRSSTGERVLTDINNLADESLRLSYHGLRAKDKSFNADFEIIIDPNLPKINVISQDIGRVLINLINNAFYAVASATSSGTLAASLSQRNHLPKVIVVTQLLNKAPAPAMVEIRVTDNGTGMSEAIKAKIFQPFFTTKPTGQGTGLGLSLTYDIVTKGHGGTIECESKEGEGSTFLVHLPI